MKRSLQSGFTLPELLLSIGVASVLVMTCGVIMKMGADQHKTVSTEQAQERNIHMVVWQVMEDLAVAYRMGWHESVDEDACLAGWFVLMPGKVQSNDGSVGDLCSVGYGLRNMQLDPNSEDVVRCLVRLQHDSQTVYQAISNARRDELWALGGLHEPLASGILEFELWPLMQQGPDDWQPWHPELKSMPEAVELRLVMVSPSLQKRLKTHEDWEWARLNQDQFDGRDTRELRTLIYLGPYAD